jgi:predicted metalloendopeptidase
MPIVHNAQALAGWKASRTTFLEETSGQFPPAVSAAMNFSMDPCTNFYEYSCGKWEEQASIPADSGGIAMAWDEAEDHSYAELKAMFEKEYPEDSKYRKVSDWYKSCMDTERADELGAEPLRPWLKQIDAIKTHDDLWDLMSSFQLWSIPTFVSLSVSTDERSPLKHDLFLDAGGYILPDASYYDEDDDDAVASMTALKEYLRNITLYTGYSEEEAHHSANRTLEVEMALAEFMYDEPIVKLEDSYEHMNLTELENHAPNIPWAKMFGRIKEGCKEQGVTCLADMAHGRRKIVLDAPYFYQALSEKLGNHSATYWVPYLRTHLIYNLSPLLSEKFLNATFKLDADLEGMEARPPRWKKCVGAVKHALPGLTDELYTSKLFPAKARKDAEVMMSQLRDAFVSNLKDVHWMDEETKTKAVEKAENIQFNIGAPKHQPAYLDDYPVTPHSYFNNSMLAYHYRKLFKLSKLGKPVDRHEWSMRASTVNAYYDNGVTALFVPAAVLQPPFFSDKYPAARNFGGIGAVMGHEFTHGFDNTGRKFDAHSQLHEWWKKPVVKKYQDHSHCIEDLYSNFEIADIGVDGNGTLGENIADMGGLKISLKAWENLHTTNFGKEPTHQEQRLFFVSFAQNWCDKNRYKAEQQTVLTDEHAPNLFRVNGPVSQSDEFAAAFGCPKGAPMNPAKKCVLWKDTAPSEVLAQMQMRKPRSMRALAEQR